MDHYMTVKTIFTGQKRPYDDWRTIAKFTFTYKMEGDVERRSNPKADDQRVRAIVIAWFGIVEPQEDPFSMTLESLNEEEPGVWLAKVKALYTG
jgi:hypothetical protein